MKYLNWNIFNSINIINNSNNNNDSNNNSNDNNYYVNGIIKLICI